MCVCGKRGRLYFVRDTIDLVGLGKKVTFFFIDT